MPPRQRVDRLFHRIDRISRAREQTELDQRAEAVGKRRLSAAATEHRTVGQTERRDRHPVLRQRAGLVGAQHRGRAQGLDRGSTTRQHACARNSPRTHRHEHGQYHRNLRRHHRHAERNAGQQRVEPATSQKSVQQHREYADCATDRREQLNQSAGLCVQSWRLGLERAQRLADLADLAQLADRGHFTDAGAAYHQRTRECVRQIIAARTRNVRQGSVVGSDLAHRHRLAGQQRFVNLHIVTVPKHRIGRHAIALREHDDDRRARPRDPRCACAVRRE